LVCYSEGSRRLGNLDRFEEKMGGLEEEKHARYIVSVEKKKDDFEALLIEHLRMNGAYWGLTTLDLLNKIGAIDVDEVVSWVMECQDKDCDVAGLQNDDGSFSGDMWGETDTRYGFSSYPLF
ncbi:hypothetical protein BHM03_00030033, partial [Ensete ventricosum]